MRRRLRQWSQSNPLARLALAAVAGICLCEALRLADRCVWLAAMAVVSLFGAWRWPRRVPIEAPACIVFMLVHGVRLSETQSHPLHVTLEKNGPQEARVVAYISHVPIEEFASPYSSREITLEADSFTLTRLQTHHEGRAVIRGWVRLSRAHLTAGCYELLGTLRLPAPATNPGQFDASDYAVREGYVCDMEVRALRLIKAEPLPVRAWLVKAAESCRAWIGGRLSLGLEGEDGMLTIIRAMALGTKSESDADMERPFKETGTLHVFAVSGLHVGLVSLIGLYFLRFLEVPRAPASALLIIGVFAYAFITGWTPSAARAAIMVAILIAAGWFWRRSHLQNGLGAAALVLLAFDTQHAFLPGFQLSFFVLWAIAVLSPPLLRHWQSHTELDPFLPPSLASPSQQRVVFFKGWAVKTVCVSIAAWIGSLPLMLLHFKTITPIALVANCLLVPVSTLLLGTAFISIMASVLHLHGGLVLFNNANWLWAKMMMSLATAFASIPGGHFSFNPGHVRSDAPLEMTVLDLPYGGASAFLRVAGRHWLMDTGSARAYTRITQPALQYKNVHHLDGLLLSHSDVAHVGGAAIALDDFRRPPLFISGHEPWPHESSASSLRQLLRDERLKVGKLFTRAVIDLGDAHAPPAIAGVLYPSPEDIYSKADDRALVLRLDLGGFRVLMLGDAGYTTEMALMERYSPHELFCDVLVRGNYFENLSESYNFLMYVRPRIVISSNARSLDEKMPAFVSEYCRDSSATLLDLSQTGAVTIEIKGSRLEVTTFASEQRVSLLPRM
jgi:competence protein ComEC